MSERKCKVHERNGASGMGKHRVGLRIMSLLAMKRIRVLTLSNATEIRDRMQVEN
jgi:hypothetical protein